MLILVLRSSNIAPHSLCFDFIFDILHVVMSNNELVQGAAPTTESTLTRDVLKHALAFKGNSIDLFNDAVSEVKSLTSDGSSVYPPYEYPSLYHPERATTLTKSPESGFVGRLAPAEAVAVRVLQEESLALMQSFARNFETSRKIDEILGTGEHTSQSDAMEGIVDFMQIISMASGVRERKLSSEELKNLTISSALFGMIIRNPFFKLLDIFYQSNNNKTIEHIIHYVLDCF